VTIAWTTEREKLYSQATSSDLGRYFAPAFGEKKSMTQKPDNSTSASEERDVWCWNKPAAIKADTSKKDFKYNSAEAIRQALGKRAWQL
jgi:hypothetical protein